MIDPIVKAIVKDALANGPILLRPHANDSEIVREMVVRAKKDRRFMKRLENDRRRNDAD